MLYHRHSLRVWLGTPLFAAWRILHRKSARTDGKTVDEWIRVYDGLQNPLGKVYTRAEAATMFARYRNRRYILCDSYRQRFPGS